MYSHLHDLIDINVILYNILINFHSKHTNYNQNIVGIYFVMAIYIYIYNWCVKLSKCDIANDASAEGDDYNMTTFKVHVTRVVKKTLGGSEQYFKGT